MDAAVPAVEIADDADAFCGWSPDSEVRAGDSVDGLCVRAELFVGVVVAAFGHEVKIEIAELVGECVGVDEFERDAFVSAALNFVTAGFGGGGLAGGPCGFEEAFGAEFYSVGNFGGIL